MTTTDRSPFPLWANLMNHGCKLFPLIPGDKRPGVSNWENKATNNTAALKTWPAGAGAGLACGPSGLVVVDLDAHTNDVPQQWAERGCWDGPSVYQWLWTHNDRTGHSWADTFTVATPSGGAHLYYRAPTTPQLRNSAGVLGWQIDTRAAGGYVVAPGTRLATGTYEVLGGAQEPAQLPGWVVSALMATRTPTTRPRPKQRPPMFMLPEYAGGRLKALSEKVAEAPEGERNNVLNWAAHSLARDGLLTQEHAEALHEAATQAGLTDDEITKTIHSAGQAAQRSTK